MTRGYAAIGLDRCKNPYNLGSVLRAAQCYDASLVVVGGGRFKKVSTDVLKSYRHIPSMEVDDVFGAIPFGAMPVVVELCERAKPLTDFVHPHTAYYIFGPEDGSVRKDIIERAPLVVQIPTSFCMNLAATVNVVLYDRLVKQLRKENKQ